MTFFKPFTVVLTASALALSGCVTDPSTVRQSADKTALYGLGGAAVCGIMGALTHGGKGARNSALVCGALGAGIGGYMDYQEQRLRQSLAGTQVQVQRQGNQIKLVMPENVTFATGSAVLSDNAQFALNTAAQTLVQYPDTTLTINGHTDNTGSDAINNPLSQHRAQTVAYYLRRQCGTANVSPAQKECRLNNLQTAFLLRKRSPTLQTLPPYRDTPVTSSCKRIFNQNAV